MDIWIRWLGEVFWRITKIPTKGVLQAEPRNEEFWFRSYGVAMLIGGLWIGLRLAGGNYRLISDLAVAANNFPGAEKSFAQPYIGAILILFVGTVSALGMVAVTTLCLGLITRLVTWALLRWAERYQKRHPDQARQFTALAFGLAAGLIVAALVSAAPKLNFKQAEHEPPTGQSKDETPPVA